jgi:hypothetical protein
MKGIKKKQEKNINPHVDMAINADKIAAWATSNGYEWNNFAYWKGGVEIPLRQLYNEYQKQNKQ